MDWSARGVGRVARSSATTDEADWPLACLAAVGWRVEVSAGLPILGRAPRSVPGGRCLIDARPSAQDSQQPESPGTVVRRLRLSASDSSMPRPAGLAGATTTAIPGSVCRSPSHRPDCAPRSGPGWQRRPPLSRGRRVSGSNPKRRSHAATHAGSRRPRGSSESALQLGPRASRRRLQTAPLDSHLSLHRRGTAV
jgi:hypothetical protein